MKNFRQKLGRWGESTAANYLTERGYQILETNARTPFGEIDLVARQEIAAGGVTQSVTVFIEVKTRRTTSFGEPEASITQNKREHLLTASQAYLQAHPELEGDWRVDVIAIKKLAKDQPAIITHFENAIS